MAKMIKKGLSGKTTTVNLFYDGDKYKDPLFVGINGMTRSISSIELINNDINNSYLILTLNGSLVICRQIND